MFRVVNFVWYFIWIINCLHEPSYVLFASFQETKTKKSEPTSTFHSLHDVMLDLFSMLKTYE
jgi:hypothetical protein